MIGARKNKGIFLDSLRPSLFLLNRAKIYQVDDDVHRSGAEILRWRGRFCCLLFFPEYAMYANWTRDSLVTVLEIAAAIAT